MRPPTWYEDLAHKLRLFWWKVLEHTVCKVFGHGKWKYDKWSGDSSCLRCKAWKSDQPDYVPDEVNND